MSTRNLTGTTAIVTGASRGFGRATAISLAARGAHVAGVARSKARLAELEEKLGDAFTPEVADVADPAVAADLVARYRPQTLVLNAGAAPPVGSITEQTWRRSAPTGIPTSSTCSTSRAKRCWLRWRREAR